MYGLNIDPANPRGDPNAAELRDLHVQRARYTFKDFTAGNWPSTERVNFYKSRIQAYHNAGIRSLIILSYETYPNKPLPNASDAEWEAYTTLFVQRAGQIAQLFLPWRPAFQIWNEPDLPPMPGYDPSLREAVYGRMLRRTYAAIKQVSPELTVIGAGLASGDPAWWQRVIASQNDNLPLDANGLHPYGQRPEPDWPHPGWGFGYLGDTIDRYLQVRDEPYWISECGTSTLGGEAQAEYLRRFYHTITSQYADSVPEVFWFCYSDGMVPPYGLLDNAGNRKPAYAVYRDVAAEGPPVPPPGEPYGVEYLAHNTPTTAVLGQTNIVTLRVKNSSNRLWPAGGPNPIRLGYHWYTADGQPLAGNLWDDIRTGLPYDLRAGQSVTLNARLSIPRTAGSFDLRWDMVEEQITWFEWQGVPTLNVNVTVNDPTEPPSGDLRLSASHNNTHQGIERLENAIDGNPYTRWTTQTPQQPGMWLQIDLGQPKTVGQLRLDNEQSPLDYPRGYIVRTSTDAQTWAVAAEDPNNASPLDVTFEPRQARYIRIEQTGRDPIYWWSVHNIEISDQVQIRAAASHNNVLFGPDNLTQALDGKPATRWSTFTLQQPGMWFELDLGQEKFVSGLGLDNAASPNDYPRGYIVRVSTDRAHWDEVARNENNIGSLDVTFTPRLVRIIRIEQTGRSDRFWWSIHEVRLDTSLPDADFDLRASHNNVTSGPDNLLNAKDRQLETRWSTFALQQPGMWFEIDLREPRLISGLLLDNSGSPDDYPRGYAVRFSLDRQQWQEVARKDQNNVPLSLTLPPRCARYIQIEQTGHSDSKWWSIHEVIVTSEKLARAGSAQVTARASHNNVTQGADNVNQALDGKATTRWSSIAFQRPGMWFELNLNQNRLISGLVLDTAGSPNDYPRGYRVLVSLDGQDWQEVARNDHNQAAYLDIPFTACCARYIRIEQTGSADNFWWSIHRFGLRSAT